MHTIVLVGEIVAGQANGITVRGPGQTRDQRWEEKTARVQRWKGASILALLFAPSPSYLPHLCQKYPHSVARM